MGRTDLDALGVPVKHVSDDGRLWRLLTQHPILSAFVGDGKCLSKAGGHAINIEGLAAKGGNLYFGFREPAKDKQTYILRISADRLFNGGELADKLFAVEVGANRGIRDLLAVSDGFLLLIGQDDDSADVGWSIAFWDGSGKDNAVTDPVFPKMLADLNLKGVALSSCDKELKPEAIAMLEEGCNFFRQRRPWRRLSLATRTRSRASAFVCREWPTPNQLSGKAIPHASAETRDKSVLRPTCH